MPGAFVGLKRDIPFLISFVQLILFFFSLLFLLPLALLLLYSLLIQPTSKATTDEFRCCNCRHLLLRPAMGIAVAIHVDSDNDNFCFNLIGLCYGR